MFINIVLKVPNGQALRLPPQSVIGYVVPWQSYALGKVAFATKADPIGAGIWSLSDDRLIPSLKHTHTQKKSSRCGRTLSCISDCLLFLEGNMI